MTSSILDRVFNEVCLDERISDGVFRMEEEQHMNALRDYLLKKGITKEAVVNVTNRMVEGRFPDRQAYRKEDGILVTWPSPAHMRKAFQENPGKYVTQDPFPKQHEPVEPPKKKEPPKKEEPPEEAPKEEPAGDEDKPLPKSSGGNVFGGGGDEETAGSGEKQLAIEPPRGDEKPAPMAPISPTAQPVPRTPERIAAEKEVIKQIIKTSDASLSNITPPGLSEICLSQLNELYKEADAMGYKEAVTFLTRYVKP